MGVIITPAQGCWLFLRWLYKRDTPPILIQSRNEFHWLKETAQENLVTCFSQSASLRGEALYPASEHPRQMTLERGIPSLFTLLKPPCSSGCNNQVQVPTYTCMKQGYRIETPAHKVLARRSQLIKLLSHLSYSISPTKQWNCGKEDWYNSAIFFSRIRDCPYCSPCQFS